ncbi:Undecaprenyl-phosphate 4-deoxy-4-formamido-L-arabinose transferase [Pseudobythopirellula maris]|uniref:Undecaprenyl-phosphate 4-deoxy-4-formamido-L-arabinose transferase n=1 Tax=Pseudobythopirellula maris TaxID=2527991 RepID=A0A5C5ZNK5_9BACT|nr:glycosyltransferase family 2 protein [Pseudobythopirellula maris]TWT88497.1 Undecaprenyl-phosphate 4-deoxy-4-formamido-L-arabinose transferase [Pseudobythopirellula maris]
MATTEEELLARTAPPANPMAANPTAAGVDAQERQQAMMDRINATLAEADAAIDEHHQAEAALADKLANEPAPKTRLMVSVLMPVFNERGTIREIIERVRRQGLHHELVIVDDCSTDGTRDLLIELEQEFEDVHVVLHGYNKGKGAALKTAMWAADGDTFLIQDADLEYNPADYARLIAPIERGEADVVYGSRFLENAAEQDPSWLHRFGNGMLTRMSNLTTGLALTDMETCYKVIRRDSLRGMVLREKRFGFEPEITAKLARRGSRVVEAPIAYHGRGWEEGKKIGLRDAFRAVWCILRYAWVD